MSKMNILESIYYLSPMNFYTHDEDKTIIKSINNTSLGYKFGKNFDTKEISAVWDEIKLCKKWSVILIALMLIILLYKVIFPKFTLFVNNVWYVNTIIILVTLAAICQIITKICTLIFEKRLIKKFGKFEKTIFKNCSELNSTYYSLFKRELIKALILILVVVSCFGLYSPFKKAQELVSRAQYNEVIRFTTLGSKIFPIAHEWYSLRGYAKFKTEDFQGAINDFDKAYKLGADGLNIMNFDNKIFVKYYLGEYESAIRDFNYEIKNANDDNEKDQFLWDKAQFLYNIKHYDEALELYSQLIDKAEQDKIYLLKDRLYLERAQVYKTIGEPDLYLDDIINSGAGTDEGFQNPIPQPTLMLNDF